MRILIIHTFYQSPGGEDTVFQQEQELLAVDHEVLSLTFQNKKGWKGALQTIFSFLEYSCFIPCKKNFSRVQS